MAPDPLWQRRQLQCCHPAQVHRVNYAITGLPACPQHLACIDEGRTAATVADDRSPTRSPPRSHTHRQPLAYALLPSDPSAADRGPDLPAPPPDKTHVSAGGNSPPPPALHTMAPGLLRKPQWWLRRQPLAQARHVSGAGLASRPQHLARIGDSRTEATVAVEGVSLPTPVHRATAWPMRWRLQVPPPPRRRLAPPAPPPQATAMSGRAGPAPVSPVALLDEHPPCSDAADPSLVVLQYCTQQEDRAASTLSIHGD
ncbi:UNVERIFIED_CONTAM: hypothetical protein K2H54_066322 [Gekko kuhli]